jgi:hypothetical protein
MRGEECFSAPGESLDSDLRFSAGKLCLGISSGTLGQGTLVTLLGYPSWKTVTLETTQIWGRGF